jgi:hypothetical protein
MTYEFVTAKPKHEPMDALERLHRHKAFESLNPFGQALTCTLENARLLKDGIAKGGKRTGAPPARNSVNLMRSRLSEYQRIKVGNGSRISTLFYQIWNKKHDPSYV